MRIIDSLMYSVCVCLCVHSLTMLLIDSCIWFSTEEEESLTVTQRDTSLKGTSVSFLTLPLTSVCSLCSLNISIGSFVLEDWYLPDMLDYFLLLLSHLPEIISQESKTNSIRVCYRLFNHLPIQFNSFHLPLNAATSEAEAWLNAFLSGCIFPYERTHHEYTHLLFVYVEVHRFSLVILQSLSELQGCL